MTGGVWGEVEVRMGSSCMCVGGGKSERIVGRGSEGGAGRRLCGRVVSLWVCGLRRVCRCRG